jgi:methionyl-tRNA formyltransferase
MLCVAGKNDIAVNVLTALLEKGHKSSDLCVVLNSDDKKKHTWQKSLGFVAEQSGIRICKIEELYELTDLVLLSIEYDKIIRPSAFQSSKLYNIHFSLLPAYRGVATSVWPIFYGEEKTGVTLHLIDSGIDTGPIIEQDSFEIGLHWTARDVYLNCMKRGAELIKGWISELQSATVPLRPQSPLKATYYARDEVNFRLPPLRLSGTAWQAHNSIRAFSFHEYQYPSIQGFGEVLKSTITDRTSCQRPGTIRSSTNWKATLSTRDFDVDILRSPYSALYSWARGEISEPDNWQETIESLDLNSVNAQGWTLLMVASFHENLCAVQKLLEFGANPNSQNLRGTTPLMYAKSAFAKSKNPCIINELIEKGADCTLVDVFGKTVFDYAREESLIGIIETLIPKSEVFRQI